MDVPIHPQSTEFIDDAGNRRPPALRIRWLISVLTGTQKAGDDRDDLGQVRHGSSSARRATPGRACRTGPVGARQRDCATDARNHAAVQPQPRSFVAQTEEYRALAIPWTRARATRAPAGLWLAVTA